MIARRPLLLAVSGILLAGCGPTVPLGLVMRQASVDVGGSQPPPATAPAPPLPATLPPPAFPILAAPEISLPPPSSLGFVPPLSALLSCPTAGQFAVPAMPADALIAAPPAPAMYPYRESGQASTGGALSFTITYPPIGVRTVTRGSPGQGYDFAVAEESGAGTRTAAFTLVQPSGSVSAQQGGLYLAAMQWDDPVLGKLTFKPLQPVLFMQLPVQQGTSFAAAGVDPQDQVTMSLNGQVTGKQRVDACGAVIDTWELKLSEAFVTPQSQVNVTATYDIATQYGGLSVQDDIAMSGTNAGNAAAPTPSEELKGVISQVPKDVQ